MCLKYAESIFYGDQFCVNICSSHPPHITILLTLEHYEGSGILRPELSEWVTTPETTSGNQAVTHRLLPPGVARLFLKIYIFFKILSLFQAEVPIIMGTRTHGPQTMVQGIILTQNGVSIKYLTVYIYIYIYDQKLGQGVLLVDI